MSGLLLLRRPPRVRCLSHRLLPLQVRHYALIGKPKTRGEPTWKLPSTPARTRFAPSPTGYLHLGSLRTALFNYLLARATGGQFIIRLEDTDQTRFVHDAEQRLYEDLTWAGLHWDEGPDKGGDVGPYKQSQRLALYRQHADQLLESGRAFRCFCSKEDLEFNVKQATASGATSHYPGTCTGIARAESDRRAANGEPHTVRFVSSGTPVTAPDLVYGAYRKAEPEDSFIIMKSDGWPTYHFANVVDDHYMNITHVVRGAEWLISTPMHVELYDAFGWQPPKFAHVGLLVDQQRQKLSKRDIDNIGVSVYRNNKIMPEALLNFSVLLGWDANLQNNPHLDKKGFMTLNEMKDNFTLKFTRGDIVVNLAKLKYFQTQLARNLISGQVADPDTLRKNIIGPILDELQKIKENLEKHAVDAKAVDEDYRKFVDDVHERKLWITEDHVLHVLKAWKGPVDDYIQFTHDNIFAFYPISKTCLRASFLELQENIRRIVIDQGHKKVLNTDISKVLTWFRSQVDAVEEGEWNEEKLKVVVKKLADSVRYFDEKKQELMVNSPGWKFLRWALFNGKPGLSIVPMMVLLGRTETRARLKLARRVARAEEENLENARRKAEMDTKFKKVRFRYFAGPPPTSEMAKSDAARMTIESRDVSVFVPKTKRKESSPPPIRVYDKEVKTSDRKPPPPIRVYDKEVKTRDRKSPPPRGIGARIDVQDSGGNRDNQAPQTRHDNRSPAVARGSVSAMVHQDEGPFVTRGPVPAAPKAPKRVPVDVGRPLQFLDFKSWNEGQRHLNVGRYREEEGQERRDSAAPLWGRLIKTEEAPPQEESRKERGRRDHAPAFWELQVRTAETRPKDESQSPPASPPADHWASPRRSLERDRLSKRTSKLPPEVPVPKPAPPPKKLGPFTPNTRTEDYRNVAEHVQHLRAINIAAKKKRAASERAVAREQMQRVSGPRPKLATTHGRLDALKESGTTAPLYEGVGELLGGLPRDIEAQASREQKGPTCADASVVRPSKSDDSGTPKSSDTVELDVPPREDLTKSVARHAQVSELERMVRKAAQEEDDVSMSEVERDLARQWAKRNS